MYEMVALWTLSEISTPPRASFCSSRNYSQSRKCRKWFGKDGLVGVMYV